MMSTMRVPMARLLLCRIIANNHRTICVTQKRQFFHEIDPKAGYPRKSDYKEESLTSWQTIVRGFKDFIEELKLFKEETKEGLLMDPTMICRTGEVDVTWRFDGDPSKLEKWIVTSDSDYGEGNSTASFQMSRTGKAVFTGVLDPREYNDGRIKRSGYCNVKSVRPKKSFGRDDWLDWGPYTHLIMRVRGDGRNYLLILGSPGEWDIMWNDSYQYVLHTRGGPYWQYVRIPFSKFFLVCKGRVQDEQQPVPTHLIAYLGITAADKIRGEFKLEIDYVGVENDPIMDEEFAYEMYKTPTKFHI